MKRIIASMLLALAIAPSLAAADPPPYDPISICDIPKGECYPERIQPEVVAFICSLVTRAGGDCREI